jgi:hypothetical protein
VRGEVSALLGGGGTRPQGREPGPLAVSLPPGGHRGELDGRRGQAGGGGELAERGRGAGGRTGAGPRGPPGRAAPLDRGPSEHVETVSGSGRILVRGGWGSDARAVQCGGLVWLSVGGGKVVPGPGGCWGVSGCVWPRATARVRAGSSRYRGRPRRRGRGSGHRGARLRLIPVARRPSEGHQLPCPCSDLRVRVGYGGVSSVDRAAGSSRAFQRSGGHPGRRVPVTPAYQEPGPGRPPGRTGRLAFPSGGQPEPGYLAARCWPPSGGGQRLDRLPRSLAVLGKLGSRWRAVQFQRGESWAMTRSMVRWATAWWASARPRW